MLYKRALYILQKVYVNVKFLVGPQNEEHSEPRMSGEHMFILALYSEVFDTSYYSSLAEQGIVRITDLGPLGLAASSG